MKIRERKILISLIDCEISSLKENIDLTEYDTRLYIPKSNQEIRELFDSLELLDRIKRLKRKCKKIQSYNSLSLFEIETLYSIIDEQSDIVLNDRTPHSRDLELINSTHFLQVRILKRYVYLDMTDKRIESLKRTKSKTLSELNDLKSELREFYLL